MSVLERGPEWIIETSGQRVRLHKETLVLAVEESGPAAGQERDPAWRTVEGKDAITFRMSGDRLETVPLSKAAVKRFSIYRTGYFEGIRVALSHFPVSEGEFEPVVGSDFELKLTVVVNSHTNELVCELLPITGDFGRIEHIAWPAPFEFQSIRAEDYTAVPAMQGYLIPADWDKPILRYDDGMMHGRDAYMPWWGQMKEGNGYIAIVDTFWDAKSRLVHVPEKHTHSSVVWLPSLGRFAEIRRVRYQFGNGMDYVAMAKHYRRHVQRYGRFRSLREKMAENPRVQRLMGTSVVNTLIHFYVMPESDYYDAANPANNDQRTSFAERAEQLKRLKTRCEGPVYLHVDGWGLRGYDNLHPDILPPNPYCGGWEGMQLLQDTCAELGVLMALHDQYRDFYMDAASYDEGLAVQGRGGERETCAIWPGGKHSFLCASFAKGYIERNYEQLEQGGVKPDGAYLDVFSVVPLEECFDDTHPMTRKECMEHRHECFQSIRSRGMIVSSEEPVDWTIPALDLVHHGPYALIPNPGQGPAIGIPVPLFSLVYHDAIVVPWSLGVGSWGIPEGDWGFLHGLLHAGVPILSMEATEEELGLAREMAALHRRIGDQEMIRHEFIDGSYRKQRTAYADGTVIEVDLDTKWFEISLESGLNHA